MTSTFSNNWHEQNLSRRGDRHTAEPNMDSRRITRSRTQDENPSSSIRPKTESSSHSILRRRSLRLRSGLGIGVDLTLNQENINSYTEKRPERDASKRARERIGKISELDVISRPRKREVIEISDEDISDTNESTIHNSEEGSLKRRTRTSASFTSSTSSTERGRHSETRTRNSEPRIRNSEIRIRNFIKRSRNSTEQTQHSMEHTKNFIEQSKDSIDQTGDAIKQTQTTFKEQRLLSEMTNNSSSNSEHAPEEGEHTDVYDIVGDNQAQEYKNLDFKCYVCQKIHPTQEDLLSHLGYPLVTNHIESSDSEEDIPIMSQAARKPTASKCLICQKAYNDTEMVDHMKIHSGPILERSKRRSATAESATETENSSPRIKTDSPDSSSVRKVHYKYSCQYCDKNFTRTAQFESHMNVHNGQRPYECVLCDRSYASKDSLSKHLYTHAGGKLNCPICNKRLSRKAHMINHMTLHTGDSQHQCDVCSKRYTTKESLRKHHEAVRH